MATTVEQLTNAVGGFRPETAHLSVAGFPTWDWLPFVRRGWKWDLIFKGRLFKTLGVADVDETPIILTRGESYKFPIVESNQPQWIITIVLITTTPYTKFKFVLDDYQFESSYNDYNYFLQDLKTNWVVTRVPRVLITPLGVPFYFMIVDPIQPVSVTSQISLFAELPSNMPVASDEVLGFAVGRVFVDDYNVFLDEVRKTTLELEVGKNVQQWTDKQSDDGKLIADIGSSGRRKL